MFRPRIRRRNAFHQVTRTLRRWSRLRLDRLEDRTAPAVIAWDGGPTGQGTNWLDSVNWVGDVLPGPNDDAVIGPAVPGQAAQIILTGNATVHSATVTGGTLSVGTNSPVLQVGNLSVGSLSQSGGTMSVAMTSSLIVNGTFSQTGGVLGVTVASLMPTGTPITSLVRVGGAALSGSLSVSVGPGLVFPNQTYRVLDNIGPEPVTGTFAGLPEGGRLMAGVQRVKVSYVGGTSNDVFLTLDPPSTLVWDGGPTGGGTDWFDPVNWTGDMVPTNGDSAVIGPLPGAPTVVTVAGVTTVVVNSVTVDGATLRLVGAFLLGGLTNSGTVELTSGGGRASQIQGSITNGVGGVITTLAGSAGTQVLWGTINNQGTLNIGSAISWSNRGASVNSGTMNVTGGDLTLDQSASGSTFGTTGTINVAAGRSFTIAGGTFTNFGNQTLSGGTYTLAGIFAFPGSLGFLAADLTLDGPGAAVVNSTTASNGIRNLGSISPGARLTLRNGGNIPPSGGFLNSGTLTVGAGSSLRNGVYNYGTITGSGAFFSQITNDGGTVRPGEPVGTLTFNGSYTNSGGPSNGRGKLEMDLNGTAPGTGYDQLVANANVFLGGSLAVTPGYAAPPGASFVIIDNRGTQPVYGTFDGLPEGAVLTAGGQGFRISYAGGDGNDVTLTRTGPVLPRVQAVQVNDGSAQRSGVTGLTVAFNTAVTFAGAPAAAFSVTQDGTGAAVGFTATISAGGSVLTLGNFSGSAVEARSLADGGYTLTVLAGQVSSIVGPLDGNGDGTGGDNYTFGSSQGLYRLYGDASGDRRVDAADLSMFRQTFGRTAGDPQYLSWLDVNADGAVNGLDLARFRQAYTASPPLVSAVQVNDGSAQRSRVTSLTVTFSTFVTFAGPAADAFVLTRDADGAPVAFTATMNTAGGFTVVTLNQFAGPAAEAGSLADGRYTLKVLASQISTPGGALDGNADGTPGDDYWFGSAQGLVRQYGDANGDGVVNGADLALFRQTFGRVAGDPLYLSLFDVNGDGAVNGTDLTRFRQAFGGGG